ncbi:MAG TPA: DUF6624 domain-containing protein [Flavobacterium sp.]|nr:DUF6624 domain-containing protein [Flavobacterium sp.]
MKIAKLLTPIFLFFIVGCATKFSESQKISLKNQLKEMVETDQIAAYIPQSKYKDYTTEQWNTFKDSVFTSHQNVLENIYKKYGFLGFDKVDKDGSQNFWILVQHCDDFPEFQKDVLKSMKQEVKNNNASPRNYAYLYDRVQVNLGEKQLFGTQVDYEIISETVRATPKNGLLNSENIVRLRQEYELEPLKDYLNEMTKLHYEMNQSNYEKNGIKPFLYE